MQVHCLYCMSSMLISDEFIPCVAPTEMVREGATLIKSVFFVNKCVQQSFWSCFGRPSFKLHVPFCSSGMLIEIYELLLREGFRS